MRVKTILCFFTLLIFAQGCASNTNNEEIVAQVNDYQLTVSDFKGEISDDVYVKAVSKTPEERKQIILDNIVTRKILLQKAQEEGLDKNKAFMREIERYWEQALIKMLLDKKQKEIARETIVTQQEIDKECIKARKEKLVEIIILGKDVNPDEIGKNLRDINTLKEEYAAYIFSVAEPEWYGRGDLPYEYEEMVYLLDTGEFNKPVKFNDQYIVFNVIEERNISVPKEREVKDIIKQEIKEKKEGRAFNNWLTNLRSNAAVTINMDIVEDIKIEESSDSRR